MPTLHKYKQCNILWNTSFEGGGRIDQIDLKKPEKNDTRELPPIPPFIKIKEGWKAGDTEFPLSKDTIKEILFDITKFEQLRDFLKIAHKSGLKDHPLLSGKDNRDNLGKKENLFSAIAFGGFAENGVIMSMINELSKEKDTLKQLVEKGLIELRYEEFFTGHCLSLLPGDTPYFDSLYQKVIVEKHYGTGVELFRYILLGVSPSIAVSYLKKYPDKDRDTMSQQNPDWAYYRATEAAPYGLSGMNSTLLGIIENPNYSMDTKERAIRNITDSKKNPTGESRSPESSRIQGTPAIEALNSIIFREPPLDIAGPKLDTWTKEWDKLKDIAKQWRDDASRKGWIQGHIEGTNLITDPRRQWPL